MKMLVTVLITFACLTNAPSVSAETYAQLLARLPAQTVAALVTDQSEAALTQLLRTGPVRVFNGNAFEPFRRSLEKRGQALTNPLGMPLPWESSKALVGKGGFVAAVVETKDTLPEACFLLEMDNNLAAWTKLIASYANSEAAQGAKIDKKKINGYNALTITTSKLSTSHTILFWDKMILVTGSDEIAKLWTEPSVANSNPAIPSKLIDDDRYKNTIGAINDAPNSEGAVWLFVDPIRMDYLYSRAGGQALTSFTETFAAKHGFDAIRAGGGWSMVGDDQFDARYRLRFWTPGPHVKGMQLIQWQAISAKSPPKWIPRTNVSSFVRLGWDLQPILGHLGPLVNDAVRMTTGKSENTFESIIEQVKSEDGLGIDLQAELMPLLGPNIEYASVFTPPASETAEQSIAAIEVSDEAAVAELLGELLVEDGAIPLTKPGFPYPLWKIGSGKRAGDSGPTFSTPGAMVAHGRLFFASNYEAISRFVAVRQQPMSLTSDPLFLKFETGISKIAGNDPAIRIIAFPAVDFQNTYEMLRTGRADKAESVYTLLLSPMLKAANGPVSFEWLPAFSHLESVLGPTTIQLNMVDGGWDIQGINYRAAAVPTE